MGRLQFFVMPLYKEDLQRLGRFLLIRKAYSFIQNLRQRLNRDVYKKSLIIRETSVFEGVNIEHCVQEIRQDGVAFGLHLSPSLVEQIYQYASETPCSEPGIDGEFFVEEVQNGRLRGGRPVLRALVRDAMGCEAIERIVEDPTLLQIVRKYLHYWPTRITRHITWSFVTDLAEPQKKLLYPPTNFHYDVAGYNFITAAFYLTDVDLYSGAHVMIKKSHKNRPLYMSLTSGRQPDKAVHCYYGKDNEITIEGKAGFGFIQDPSCFHKVLPPLKADRLLLQIRYS